MSSSDATNVAPEAVPVPNESSSTVQPKINGVSESSQHVDPASTIPAGKKFPSNPLKFPKGLIPLFISKARNGMYHFYMHEPNLTNNYLWYIEHPKHLTLAELEAEMDVPGRRWYATDRFSYELTKKHNCSVTDGEPYVCLVDLKSDGKMYWVGPRHGEPPVEKAVLVLTIADTYLKSKIHQDRMIKALISSIRHAIDNNQVFRCGDNMIEIRKTQLTEKQMELLKLLPGIGNIYKAAPNRGGDPRGELLAHGAGGIPVLGDQPALALISGGIDSPVAAYRMMSRGCFVTGVHFLNSTDDTGSVIGKNRAIGERLSMIQGRFTMHYVDISKLQSQIVAKVPNHNRTLVYKWFMLSLAATLDDSKILVVGDSLGQVASQTIHNISSLYPLVSKAIVAPLVGLPKTYIIDEARKINTFDLSMLPGADCCQYMMCKVGANLFIGQKTLRGFIHQITLSALPVTTELYVQGKLHESRQQMLQFSTGLRATALASGATGALTDQVSQKSTRAARVASAAASHAPAPPAEEHDVVYFDAGGGTKVHPSVVEAMANAPFANPSSMHQSGREARMAIEKVRGDLAQALRVPAKDIIFTSGSTESNSIALHGCRVINRDAWSHASTVGFEESNADPSATPVRIVDLVNHETGSIETDLRRPEGGRLHVDASQALMKIDFSTLDLSQVDSIALTAHKFNGPVGIGALYIRDLNAKPIFCGGTQEKGLRPGSENVPGIVGLGAALRLDRSRSVHKDVEEYLREELRKLHCKVNFRGETSGYIVHATLPEGYDNTTVVSNLSSQFQVEIGTGSACKSGMENDGVYTTLELPNAPKRSVRFSYDYTVAMEEAEYVISSLRTVLRDVKPQNGSQHKKA